MSQHMGYQFKHETLDDSKELVNDFSSEMYKDVFLKFYRTFCRRAQLCI
jgi:hypothetical protein